MDNLLDNLLDLYYHRLLDYSLNDLFHDFLDLLHDFNSLLNNHCLLLHYLDLDDLFDHVIDHLFNDHWLFHFNYLVYKDLDFNYLRNFNSFLHDFLD